MLIALFLCFKLAEPFYFRLTTQRLDQLRFIPDFLAYLAHVLIFCTNEEESHRAVAGLLIKNTLTGGRGGPSADENPQAMAYVKNTIIIGLADKDSMIRQTAGSVIAGILSTEEPGAWPEALDAVTKGMASQDVNAAEVSFATHVIVPC